MWTGVQVPEQWTLYWVCAERYPSYAIGASWLLFATLSVSTLDRGLCSRGLGKGRGMTSNGAEEANMNMHMIVDNARRQVAH